MFVTRVRTRVGSRQHLIRLGVLSALSTCVLAGAVAAAAAGVDDPPVTTTTMTVPEPTPDPAPVPDAPAQAPAPKRTSQRAARPPAPAPRVAPRPSPRSAPASVLPVQQAPRSRPSARVRVRTHKARTRREDGRTKRRANAQPSTAVVHRTPAIRSPSALSAAAIPTSSVAPAPPRDLSPFVVALLGVAIACLAVAATPPTTVRARTVSIVLSEWHGRLAVLGAAALGAGVISVLLGWWV